MVNPELVYSAIAMGKCLIAKVKTAPVALTESDRTLAVSSTSSHRHQSQNWIETGSVFLDWNYLLGTMSPISIASYIQV